MFATFIVQKLMRPCRALGTRECARGDPCTGVEEIGLQEGASPICEVGFQNLAQVGAEFRVFSIECKEQSAPERMVATHDGLTAAIFEHPFRMQFDNVGVFQGDEGSTPDATFEALVFCFGKQA